MLDLKKANNLSKDTSLLGTIMLLHGGLWHKYHLLGYSVGARFNDKDVDAEEADAADA